MGDEYESLPPSAPWYSEALAGSIAGVVEHALLFPIDVVKTRLHRLRPSPNATYSGPISGLQTIVATEGVPALFRGFTVIALGAGPAHAMYFTFYEQTKRILGVSEDPSANPLGTAVAAVAATIAHEGTMNPIEVVKQRLQLYQSPYKNPIECVRKILVNEGPLAFYRSYSTQLVMSVPYQITHLVTYETLRERLNPTQEYSPTSHLLAGAGAGALASAITNPFDVVKTLLNTQEPIHERRLITGISNAFKAVYTTNGLMGFTKGIYARIIIATPATALSWLTYEFFKHTFLRQYESEVKDASLF